MRNRSSATVAVLALSVGMLAAGSRQVTTATEAELREYDGVYAWGVDSFVYLQLWNELSGTDNLTAFDDSGEVRTLYPDARGRDRFFTGGGAAVAMPVESRVAFQRSATGAITSLTWTQEGGTPRTARRVENEHREDVGFPSGNLELAGTLIRPSTVARVPAVILVHGSGPMRREGMLPFARFLIRDGIAVLTYDKRGVGDSTGNWQAASFGDLAEDVVSAFAYLKTRKDIDSSQIGVLGVSQAGWIMPIAATRAPDIAFLISISGPGVPAAETTIDHARNEMFARGMPEQDVTEIIEIMKLQYHFARTHDGWNDYLVAREQLLARLARPPGAYPETQEHPYWQFIRRLYFYDPAPTLRQLQTPTLALFGELDNNVLATKNRTAWDVALKAGGNRDYTLLTLPRANHILLEAKIGSNAEMASLRRFVPGFVTTVREWLSTRLRPQ